MSNGTDDRVKVIDAIFKGIERLIFAVTALVTIWVQLENKGKLDTAAATTKAVEYKLESTTARHDRKLDDIDAKAEASALSWKAYKSKDPGDMDVAEKALDAAAPPK